MWKMGVITSFLTKMYDGFAPTPQHCYVQLCLLLHIVLHQPQEIRTGFIELLLRDFEEMGSEKQNNLSQITVDLAPSQPTHSCELHEDRDPLK